MTDDNEDASSITLVGKGIVYDTGGLAIKSRIGMCGMKHDMGGSAGVLGGFMAAVQLRTPRKIRLLLCLVRQYLNWFYPYFRTTNYLRKYLRLFISTTIIIGNA